MRSKIKYFFFLASFCIFFIFSFHNCNRDTIEKKQVICTTSIIADVVKQILKDKMNCSFLIKTGQDPHSYELTSQDSVFLEKARLVFVNGFNLEGNLINIAKKITKAKIVEVSEKIIPLVFAEGNEKHSADSLLHEGDSHSHSEYDPHTWFSPLNVISWCDVISKALSEIDPLNTVFYQENAKQYQTKLVDLHNWIKETFAQIPPKQKILICEHYYLNYFARDYSFSTPLALIDSFSSLAEPSPKIFKEIISFFEKNKIPAIFLSTSSGIKINKLAENLKSELSYSLRIAKLLTGSLNPPGEEADNYLDFMKYNVGQILNALR